MDELSGFRGAPPGLRAAEAELFSRADLVFTGGQTLYESKKLQHPSVHCFPSSIDREFFGTARQISTDPEDQASIPRPRIGYCGVIDERMDTELLAAVADARPEWQIVMIGPVVKIADSDLPQRGNIHYLGPKDYRTLPACFPLHRMNLLDSSARPKRRNTWQPDYRLFQLPSPMLWNRTGPNSWWK
jgi:UDP-galactopyranose mutase